MNNKSKKRKKCCCMVGDSHCEHCLRFKTFPIKKAGWAVIFDDEKTIVAVPYSGSICGLAIFHTKTQARVRQKQILKRIKTTIVPVVVTHKLPSKRKKR